MENQPQTPQNSSSQNPLDGVTPPARPVLSAETETTDTNAQRTPANETSPSQNQTPPNFDPSKAQLPPAYYMPRPVYKPGEKLLIIGVLSLVLAFAAFCVYEFASERKHTACKAYAELTGNYSTSHVASRLSRYGDSDNSLDNYGIVTIQGPFIHSNNDSVKTCVVPSTFKCDAQIKTESVHRGPYQFELFRAPVSISATFPRTKVDNLGSKVILSIDIDPSYVHNLSAAKVNGKEYQWESDNNSLNVVLNTTELSGNTITLTTEMEVRGGSKLAIARLCNNTHINISGNAKNPSFGSNWIPAERTVKKNDFNVTWNGGIVQKFRTVSDLNSRADYAVVSFLVGVDNYQKVERMLKYAILIIVLTFVGVWVVELVTRHPIPLLNYFLIGCALVVCYALLLSLSEHSGFGISYLVSTAMTIALISGYMWKQLKSKRMAIIIAISLAVLYAVCYVMFCAEYYALLVGTLLLFTAVALAMWGTLYLKKS